MRAVSLKAAPQAAVERQWLERLERAPVQAGVRSLYGGRGFSLAAAAAESSRARLIVISAGLGLVEAERRVPSYGLTVGGQGEDLVGARVTGDFDPRSWWAAVKTGPFSSDWADILRPGSGPLLMALTRPYARMVARDLEDFPDSDLCRLRIFGHALEHFLPDRVRPFVMPYDARLDAIFPGTRTDFPQRALAHFARTAGPSPDAAADRAAVSASLEGRQAPARIRRPRLQDEAVVNAIARHLPAGKGIGRILRRLRHEDGIACEQRRFTRLYRVAESRAAGS